ncbi:GntR family transcriptional regulator [Polynucleobacter sp. AP-Nino-20-G2]|uniref:GntR family transcriptional regulator n=1 Tax=Polynucleobacter sp. AP-Nino-20-G2 TaxID=2576917 RepID=UPI001BFD6D99|nr:GntR family transcriptional regulator [Polynucleobacter sp. AP-Nino-20-G2]QWE17197.1 GntR family transcriptional regulator [Polynucleobacter sp. AP-Nino-20-G2]
MKDSLPLYKTLANVLAEHIRDGEWAVGSHLPSEAALCEKFKASRHTLRHALQVLEADGLVLRRQGAPTQVISRQKVRRFTQSFNSPIDILSYPRNTYRENIVEEFIELDKPLSEMIGGAVGSSWYHIGGIRKQQDSEQIIAWTDIYILPQFASLTSDPEHSQVMVFEQIEKKYGTRIDRAEVDVYAISASASLAKKLQLKARDPCLVIVRRYFDDQDKLFEITFTYHPENKYTYQMDFKSGSGN